MRLLLPASTRSDRISGIRNARIFGTSNIDGTAFTRWDEKAGLRGMRYAPNDRRARGRKEKETGYEED
jgi:hypothetical protein